MSMKFENAFEVPLSVDQTWDLLLDIEALAPCFPGARLTEVLDPRTFHGEVSELQITSHPSIATRSSKIARVRS